MDETPSTSKRKWAPITPLSIRLDFEKDPVAHTLIHMAGKNAPSLIRKVLREYAVNNGLPAADPVVQQELAMAGTRRLLESVNPVATSTTPMAHPTQAAPAPTPVRAQEHSTPSPQDQQVATPKPRRALDFGATPAAECPSVNQDQVQAADPVARQHHQWFKDDDKY